MLISYSIQDFSLSCLGSLVGKSVGWNADGCMWVRVSPEVANLSLKNDFWALCCFALPFCCVVIVALPFSAFLTLE